MRSKSPLALMEQVLMVLVFALAAGLCLRVFAFSDRVSARNEAIDRAVLECQNAAETLKSTGCPMAEAQKILADRMGGTMEQGLVQVCYDENWAVLPGDAAECVYVLEVQGIPAGVDGLAKANVCVAALEDISVGGNGERLFSIDVAWQEVNRDE